MILRPVSGIVGIITVILLSIAILLFCGRSMLTVAMPLNNAEAIVLLAGNYEERAPAAAAIFLAGSAKSIILANDGVRRGWSREHQRNLYSIERSEEELVKLGVPRKVIVRLPFLKSGTVYDALAVREYISSHNIRNILLVTSDYHTYRTLWVFQRVLKQLPITIGIKPTPSTLRHIPDVAVEFVKLLYYFTRFGLLDDIPVIAK